VALLSEPSIGKAAAACGLGEKTLRRRLTDDAAFQAEYEAARRATFQAAISRIPALTGRAVDTLAALLGDQEPPTVRLGRRGPWPRSGCISTMRRRSCGSWTRSKPVSGGR